MRTWIAVFVLAVAVAACGGSDTVSSDGTGSGTVGEQGSESEGGQDDASAVPSSREDRLRPTPAPTPRDLVPGESPGEQGGTGTGTVPDDLLDTVLADAAERTGVAPGQIDVEQARTVTWSDGALGCPEPGMTYTQQLIDGYWIVLQVDGEQLDYRADGRGAFRLCEGGGSAPVGNPVE